MRDGHCVHGMAVSMMGQSMTETLTHIRLSWHEIETDCRQLAQDLRDCGPFDGIVAVTRGGLVPAGLLAALLDVRLIDTICASSYHDTQAGEVTLLKSLTGDGAGWLIVDDLVDSGATLRVIRQGLPHATYATLYAKPNGAADADRYVRQYAQSDWLVFPWELDPVV